MGNTDTLVKGTTIKNAESKDKKELTKFQEKALSTDAFNTTKLGRATGAGVSIMGSLIKICGSLLLFPVAFLVTFIPLLGGLLAVLIGLSALFMIGQELKTVLVSSIFTASAPLKKTIEIECPYCSEKMQVFTKSNKKLCSNCHKIIVYLRNGNANSLAKLQCGYCSAEFAGPRNIEKFRCINCGKKQTAKDGKVENIAGAEKDCPSCSIKIDESVYYCKHCNEIIDSSFVDLENGTKDANTEELITVESRIGKSALGHYIHSSALIANVTKMLSEKIWIAGDMYSESKSLLRIIDLVCEGAEEALGDDDNAPLVAERMIPKLDKAYALILAKLYREIDQHKKEERRSRSESAFSYFKELPYVDSRKKILEKLTSANNKYFIESFSAWDKKLFETSTSPSASLGSLYDFKDTNKVFREIKKLDKSALEVDYSVRNLSSILEKWSCIECAKEETGVKIPGGQNSHYASTEKIRFLLPPEQAVSFKKKGTNLTVMDKCESCGAIYCNGCANKNMNPGWTTGFSDEPCPSCASSFGVGPTLVKINQ